MRSKNRNKYVRVSLYIHAHIYRHEQNMGTAGEMRKTAMKLSQTWTNCIKPHQKETQWLKRWRKVKWKFRKTMKNMKQNNVYNNGPRRRYVPKKCSEKWMKVHEPKWVSMPWHIHVLPLINNSWKSKLETFSVYIYFCVVDLHQLCVGGQWDGILFWLTVLKPRLVWGDLIFCSAW